MKPSWVTWVGPKFNGKCPCKDRKQPHTRKGLVKTEAESGVTQPQETPGVTRSWNRPGRTISKTFGEMHNPSDTSISNFWPLQL